MAPDPEAEEIEVRLVLEAIFLRYGYDLRGYAAASIRRRVKAMLAQSGLPNLGALQHRLVTDAAFFASVVDDLTVQVSDMFRDPEVYRVFRERVVPVLRTYPQVKIWHAGCASGEEVYATAILLQEEGLYERTQIYATDLSTRAVQRARDGVYAASRAAAFADNYQRAGGGRSFGDYVATAYDRVAMNEALRRHVVFFQHDLVSDHSLGEMHVIFCRNVLIYFGPSLRHAVLDKVGHSLAHGGFLFLGTSERVAPADAAGLVEFAGAERIYQWKGAT